jgi:hypothetical protein
MASSDHAGSVARSGRNAARTAAHDNTTASTVEGVRHFWSDLVTWRHDRTQAIPDRCIGRRVELGRSVSDVDE